jgi:quercetin dioxygenase-like cupin family protein
MHVLQQPDPIPAAIPGIHHATWAGADDGLKLSVWRQSLEPGAATPPHQHAVDEVVLCLAGSGEVEIDGHRETFGPHQTIVLPAGKPHQLRNTGATALELVAVFGESPVRTCWPDGSDLEVPWRT